MRLIKTCSIELDKTDIQRAIASHVLECVGVNVEFRDISVYGGVMAGQIYASVNVPFDAFIESDVETKEEVVHA